MRLYLCFSRLFEFQMLMLQLNFSGRFEFFGMLISFIFIIFSETVSFFYHLMFYLQHEFVCNTLMQSYKRTPNIFTLVQKVKISHVFYLFL